MPLEFVVGSTEFFHPFRPADPHPLYNLFLAIVKATYLFQYPVSCKSLALSV